MKTHLLNKTKSIVIGPFKPPTYCGKLGFDDDVVRKRNKSNCSECLKIQGRVFNERNMKLFNKRNG